MGGFEKAGEAGGGGNAGGGAASGAVGGGGSAAGSSAVSSGGQSAAGGGAAAAGGASLGGVTAGIGLAMTAYDLLQAASDNRKQLKKIRRQQLLNHQNKSNVLEEQLAARRARVGSMGISTTGSVAAANNKLIDDTYSNIALDDEAYNDQYKSINNEYKEKLRKQYLSAGMGLANKVIK